MQIWRLAVHHWRFTLLMFLMAIALGLFALARIPRQEDPGFFAPSAAITVTFPGADPVEVERLAVDPIEDALAELDDVKEIHSTSEDGVGVVNIDFDFGLDPQRKFDEVVREVNALRGSLPPDIRRIEFRKASPSLVNIVQLALVSETADALTLKNLAEDLEESIETVPGVRAAETWGYPQPEVRAAIDLARLAQFGLSLDAVIEAMSADGRTVPAGAIDAGDRRFNLKASGDYEDVAAVGDTIIDSTPDRLVRLRDVAQVGWAAEEAVYLARYNGKRAAFVTANMKDGNNIFAVHDAIRARADQLRARLPADVELVLGFDQSRNVADRLNRLGLDFSIAVGLVLMTLLPLGLRAAGIVGIAIPLSLALGVLGLWAIGQSLNQISIAGFVVALGLLVDDAIVVVENISRWLREGLDRAQAAIRATEQIALAVVGCTATLLLAFLPLMNLPEGTGEFIRGLPLAVVFTILASLLVAFTIVPFLASRFLPKHESPEGNWLLRAVRHGIHRVYAPVMRHTLRWPKLTLLAAFLLVALSLAVAPRLGFSLFPAADKPQFLVTIHGPEGASLVTTDRALRFVEDELARHPQIVHRMSNLGHGNPRIYFNIPSRETKASTAEVFASLDRWDPEESPRLLNILRERFSGYPQAQIVVTQFQNGPPIEAPIAVRIVGPALNELQRLAREVEVILATTEGTIDVVNLARRPLIDLDLGIDREKAALVGLDSDRIDRTVRLAVSGLEVASFHDTDGDAYPVRLRLPMAQRPEWSMLDDIHFLSGRDSNIVPLRQVASPRLESGPNQIRRFNRERLVTVTAQIATGRATSDISAKAYERLRKLKLPAGYRILAGGEAEATQETLGGLGTSVLIASFGILSVLVLEFGSFRSMLIVAGVVPFGMVGVMAALFLSGYPFSFMAIIGLVALLGVEIKNSILLVDFTNQLREQGMALDQAIESAGETRFLPVLLTSVTAIGGLLPLALSDSALYSPLAIVMIGGLVSSTLLARIVTPVMYKLLPP